MESIDWTTTFKAFDGPAKLDASYMVKQTVEISNTGVWEDDTEADCRKFYDWIEHLRLDVNSTNSVPGLLTGIQPAFVDDVRKLLDTFFPIRDADNKWKPAVRIKTKNDKGFEADPRSLRFGNKNSTQRLQILDAASALGYIFTVAKHPENATWQHYYLPLSLLYCRFLYLAFVIGLDGSKEVVDTASDVPQTSCVMYAGAGEPIRYYYGSSPARVYTPVGEKQDIRNNSLQALDTYRLGDVLKPSLKELTNDTKRIPQYSPKAFEDLVVALWTALTTKQTALDYEKDPLKKSLPKISKIIKGLYEEVFKPERFDALPLAKIRGHGQLGPRLEQSLRTLVSARFLPSNGTYDKDKPETVAAWQDLLATYLFPHMIPQTPTGKKDWGQNVKELPENPITKPIIDQTKAELLSPFWVDYKDQLQQTLQTVYDAEHSKHPRNPFGRCAETYCVVSMLPLFNEPARMDTVRGIALAVTPIGNSDAFKNKFDTFALGKASESSILRKPCVNCQELLPLYGIVTGRPHYDEDLFTVPNQVGDPN